MLQLSDLGILVGNANTSTSKYCSIRADLPCICVLNFVVANYAVSLFYHCFINIFKKSDAN